MQAFHLAFPVNDIESTEHFYVDVIGCVIGRRATRWIDFNFFGHQISAHVKPEELSQTQTNAVDGEAVPVRHFGLVMGWQQWHTFKKDLIEKKVRFLIEPCIRFEGEVGEQATLFIQDPSGNALEFKAFKNEQSLFEY